MRAPGNDLGERRWSVSFVTPSKLGVVVRALTSMIRPSQPGPSQMKRKAECKLEMIKRIEALIAALT
jgi:hypothetical protein